MVRLLSIRHLVDTNLIQLPTHFNQVVWSILSVIFLKIKIHISAVSNLVVEQFLFQCWNGAILPSFCFVSHKSACVRVLSWKLSGSQCSEVPKSEFKNTCLHSSTSGGANLVKHPHLIEISGAISPFKSRVKFCLEIYRLDVERWSYKYNDTWSVEILVSAAVLF